MNETITNMLREEDRLESIIVRAEPAGASDQWTLAQGDYLWLICEVARLRGKIEGIVIASSWKGGTP